MQYFTIRVAPEMECNVARLDRRNGSQPLIVMGPGDIVDLGRIQWLHSDILDNTLHHCSGQILFVLCRALTGFQAKQQVVMLDLLSFPRILLG